MSALSLANELLLQVLGRGPEDYDYLVYYLGLSSKVRVRLFRSLWTLLSREEVNAHKEFKQAKNSRYRSWNVAFPGSGRDIRIRALAHNNSPFREYSLAQPYIEERPYLTHSNPKYLIEKGAAAATETRYSTTPSRTTAIKTSSRVDLPSLFGARGIGQLKQEFRLPRGGHITLQGSRHIMEQPIILGMFLEIDFNKSFQPLNTRIENTVQHP